MGKKMNKNSYIREVPRASWFLKQPRYIRYMAREVTSLFIGAYTLMLVIAIKRVAEGPDAFQNFLEILYSPLGILFNISTLLAALYHSTSWFNVTPQAMPIQWGEEFVSGRIIVGAHYIIWIAISILILVFGV